MVAKNKTKMINDPSTPLEKQGEVDQIIDPDFWRRLEPVLFETIDEPEDFVYGDDPRDSDPNADLTEEEWYEKYYRKNDGRYDD